MFAGRDVNRNQIVPLCLFAFLLEGLLQIPLQFWAWCAHKCCEWSENELGMKAWHFPLPKTPRGSSKELLAPGCLYLQEAWTKLCVAQTSNQDVCVHHHLPLMYILVVSMTSWYTTNWGRVLNSAEVGWINTGSSKRGVCKTGAKMLQRWRRTTTHSPTYTNSPQCNLPCIHFSILGLIFLLPVLAVQDGLPVLQAQSAASRPPGFLLAESSWDPQILPPPDTQHSLRIL